SLDLISAKGRAQLLQLASTSEALLDSSDPGYLDGLGLDYNHLSRRNPGLVVTSLTGFGLSGPKRNLTSTDIVAYAMGGLMSLNGYADTPPLDPAGDPAYIIGSLNAACATIMALYDNMHSRLGRRIDISLQESVAQLTNCTGVGVYFYDHQLRTRASVP